MRAERAWYEGDGRGGAFQAASRPEILEGASATSGNDRTTVKSDVIAFSSPVEGEAATASGCISRQHAGAPSG